MVEQVKQALKDYGFRLTKISGGPGWLSVRLVGCTPRERFLAGEAIRHVAPGVEFRIF